MSTPFVNILQKPRPISENRANEEKNGSLTDRDTQALTKDTPAPLCALIILTPSNTMKVHHFEKEKIQGSKG